MTYTTQPGTIPHRVITHLKGNPGAELSTGEFCEMLGSEPTSFSTCMTPARRAGMVKCRRIPGRGMPLFWSLSDGTPAPLPHDFEPDKPLPRTPVAPPKPDHLFIPKFGGEPERDLSEPAAVGRSEVEVPTSENWPYPAQKSPAPFFVGAGLGGALVIEKDGQRQEYSADEARLIGRVCNAGAQA